MTRPRPRPPRIWSEERLRIYLATRDVPCINCRYNLRGTAGPVCPECGAPVVLPGRAPGFPVAWSLGLAAMLATYLHLAIIAASVARGEIILGLIALAFLVESPRRIRRWLRTRRAFALLPRHLAQQRAALWCLAAAVSGLPAWTTVIRWAGP